MVRVRCVMMQRDETILLEPWLRYHGYLFGFDNLVVLDNGSIDATIIETLDRYEAIGVTVYRNLSAHFDFEQKGHHIGELIRSWDDTIDYDFALPMDCDEFITLLNPGGLTCERSAIIGAFDQMRGERQALGIELALFNTPERPATFIPRLSPKGFVAQGTLRSLDCGFHEPTTIDGGRRETSFVYIHYHNKPFDLAQRAATWKLSGRLDITDPTSWQNYAGPGHHLLPLLRMTANEYRLSFANTFQVRFDAFDRLLRSLCHLDPALFPPPLHLTDGTLVLDRESGDLNAFNEDNYLRIHRDVADNGIGALRHYLLYGYEERRPLC